MSVEAALPQVPSTSPSLPRPRMPVRARTVSESPSMSSNSSSGQQLRSILLKNPPPRLEIKVSSVDSQPTSSTSTSNIRQELDHDVPPLESSGTSTSNRTSSASCSSSDASAETSTGLLTPSSSNSSTCTSLTRTPTEPCAPSPSSSTTPSPSISFAPLPKIAPRKRNSSRPIGIAARGQILRQRREQMQQDVTTYYVNDQSNPDAGFRALESVNSNAAANVGGSSGGGTYRIVVTPEQAQQMRMHAAIEAHARAKMQSAEARMANEEEEEERDDGSVVEDPIVALGRMLNDATKVLWRRVSNAKIKEPSTSSSERSTEQRSGGGEHRHTGSRRGKSRPLRFASSFETPNSNSRSATISSNSTGSSPVKPKRRKALPDPSSDSDSVDELWKKDSVEDPMTRTIVSGSDDEDGFEHYVPAPEAENDEESECFEDAAETEEDGNSIRGETEETGEEDNRSIADVALKEVEIVGQAC